MKQIEPATREEFVQVKHLFPDISCTECAWAGKFGEEHMHFTEGKYAGMYSCPDCWAPCDIIAEQVRP